MKLKGKIFDACVQRVLVYGSETWAIMNAGDLARLRREERMMARRMCGVSLKDRKRSDELLSRLGIECVENKIQRARLRWFGHVEWKEENNWVKKCTRMNVTGVVDRGALRKTWRSCVRRDMEAMGIKEEMAQDRCAWRNYYYYYYYKRLTCSQYEVPEHVSSTDNPKRKRKIHYNNTYMRSKTTDSTALLLGILLGVRPVLARMPDN